LWEEEGFRDITEGAAEECEQTGDESDGGKCVEERGRRWGGVVKAEGARGGMYLRHVPESGVKLGDECVTRKGCWDERYLHTYPHQPHQDLHRNRKPSWELNVGERCKRMESTKSKNWAKRGHATVKI
jgi:hypothetical protein